MGGRCAGTIRRSRAPTRRWCARAAPPARAALRVLPAPPPRVHVLLRATYLPLQARRTSPARSAARRALRDPELVLLARPWPKHVLRPMAVAAGVRVVGDPRCEHDVALGVDVADVARPGVPVLNARCRDISKTHVAAVFAEVFGYALAVDPTTHAGPLVEKSDANSTRDGRVLLGPAGPARAAARPGPPAARGHGPRRSARAGGRRPAHPRCTAGASRWSA